MEYEALDLDPTYLPALILSNNELYIVLHSRNNKFKCKYHFQGTTELSWTNVVENEQPRM